MSRRRSICAGIVLGVVLSYGIGAWLFVLREYADGRQTRSYLAQWLGASTLALPVVVLAVIAAVALAVRTLAPRGGPQQLITIGASAPAASLAFAATFPIRDALFGAGDSAALPAPVRVARDTLVALAIALPLAALGVSLFLSGRTRVTRTRAVVLAGGAAVLAAASLGGSVRAADPDPGQPCPATAPVKTFDVQAINVDITLNRFGDHDPTGKMFVLSNRVADVRAEEKAPLPNRVSIGLREDPIQPLVLRANQGDCIEIKFTNNATAVRSASTSTGSRSRPRRPVTRSDATHVRTSAWVPSRTYRYFVPNDDTLEGAHYIAPARESPGGRARAVRRARRRASGLELPEHDDRRSARVGLGGVDRPQRRQGVLPRVRSGLPRGRGRGLPHLDQERRQGPAGRPVHDVVPAGRPRDELSLRGVHEPAREGARPGVAGLRLLRVRRPRDADDARLPARPDEDPPRARRRRDVPRLPPPRRRRPLALQPLPTRRKYAATGREKDPPIESVAVAPGSTRRPSGRARATTSRSRAVREASSRLRATSSTTATSPSTTSRACGASGGCTTRAQPDLAQLPDRPCRCRRSTRRS